jgi:hypothetical protein
VLRYASLRRGEALEEFVGGELPIHDDERTIREFRPEIFRQGEFALLIGTERESGEHVTA